MTTKLLVIGASNVKTHLAEWTNGLLTAVKKSKNGYLLKQIMFDGKKKAELSKEEQELFDQVDYLGQGLLAERVDATYAGVISEKDTAHGQYAALMKMLQRVGLGTADEIEFKLKSYKQMDEKTGEIETLEMYLKTKQDWINQLEKSSVKTLASEDKIKLINSTLCGRHFPYIMQKYSSESSRKGTNLVEYLEELRQANDIRLGGDDDEKMVIDGNKQLVPLVKQKGFKQQNQYRQESSVLNLTCFKCKRPGHMAKDCRGGGTFKCYSCNEVGHAKKDCPKRKDAVVEAKGKKAWGRTFRSMMAKVPNVDIPPELQASSGR